MGLHYFNEMIFFFFLLMCLTFTDFMSDISTRTRVASSLSVIMFVVLTINTIVCLVAIIIWGFEKFKPFENEKPSRAVAPLKKT